MAPAAAAPAGASNTEANKAGVRAFYDQIINAHQPDSAGKFCAADVVDHNPEMGHSGQGLDDMKASFKEWFASMPDVHVTVDQIVAEGDMVAVVSTMTGTMKGDMGPMKATNKSCKVMGTDFIKLKDGKCVERWGLTDGRAMMMQLGLMPPPPGAPMGKKMKS